jgi:serine/threonine-protein kinase RsbT
MGFDASGELPINTESDIGAARRAIREAATQLGFSEMDVTRIVTAASELARNVFKYAGKGLMRWRATRTNSHDGIELQFVDHGPGIQDITLALRDGYSTSRGLGKGLSGAKRLMDHLEIQSVVGEGTTVTLNKWRKT